MALNPQIAAVLDAMASLPRPDLATVTPDEMRASIVVPPADNPPQMAFIRDLTVDLEGRSLAARLYMPEGAGGAPAVTLFFHGGGWVICSIETHDLLCRALARESGAAVISLDYRLAPETAYPGPLDDCFEALAWVHDHAAELGVDAERMAVAGDSAGGNLAAAVAIRARDEGGPALRHQLLIYPVTDCNFETGSYREHGGEGSFLPEAMMRWFWQHYLGELDHADELAAPLRHDNLTGLPVATVILAECDVLRDEGLAYAQALAAAGVDVASETATGMIHGFLTMLEAVPDGHPYLARAAQRMRASLA